MCWWKGLGFQCLPCYHIDVPATVTFHRIMINSQKLGSDEHMVSIMTFTLTIGDESFEKLMVVVKQTVGSDFNTAPLEVSAPIGYEGAINFNAFRDEVENYYRERVGERGRVLDIDPSAIDTLLTDCMVVSEKVVQLPDES